MIDQRSGRNPKYVNHDDEMAAWAAKLAGGSGVRTFALGGKPGVGTSATVNEFSYRMEQWFPDGCLFGALGGGVGHDGAEADVVYGFLLALGVPPREIPDRLDARLALYRRLTEGRRFQVILDGASSAAQVRMLSPGAGDSLVLVTEARALDGLVVEGEVLTATLEPLTEVAAIDLLTRVVGADRVSAEPEAVRELVELCWYLPIALCVVSAMVSRSASRTFESMVERLRDERGRLTALSGRDLCVRSTFNAAYGQLSPTAQACYRVLGLRPRTDVISVDAVAAVLQRPRHEAVAGMDELDAAGFVDEFEGQAMSGWFRVGNLVQVHAEDLEQGDAPQRKEQVARLLDFYHQRTLDADAVIAAGRPWRRDLLKLRAGRSFTTAKQARHWLRVERFNVRAAIEFLADANDGDRVGQWCVLLWPFYEKEKLVDDLFAVHRLALREQTSDSRVRSLLYTQRGYGHNWLHEFDEAVTDFEAGLKLAGEGGNLALEATAAEGLGLAEFARGGLERSRSLLRRNLEMSLSIGDDRRVALARFHLAKAESPEVALDLLAQAETVFESRGEEDNLAKVSLWRGKKLLELGEWEPARSALDEALTAMSNSGRPFDEAEVQEALGDLSAATGDYPGAAGRYAAALTYHEHHGFVRAADRVRGKVTALSA